MSLTPQPPRSAFILSSTPLTPPVASTTPPTPDQVTPPKPPSTKLPETETEKKFFQAIKDNQLQSAVNIILKSPDGKQIPIVKLADEDGMTGLHWVVKNRNAAGVRWLLDKKPEFDLKDNQGRTPLKIALDNKDTRSMTLLLDKGADPTLALPGHEAAEFKGFKKTSELVDFMIKTAAADAAKPPPAVAPPVNDPVTIEPAKVEPVTPTLQRRSFGPQM